MKTLGTFAAGEAMGSGNQVLGIFQDSVLDISGTLLQKGYSRGQEKNADLGALELTGRDRLRAWPCCPCCKKSRRSRRRKPRPFRPIRPRPSASPTYPAASASARRRATARSGRTASAVPRPLNLKRFWLSTALIFACTFALGNLASHLFEERSMTRRSACSAVPARRRSSWSRSTRKASISTTAISRPPGPGRAAFTPRAVDFLTTAGAKAVVIDMIFSEPSLYGGEDDEWLAAAMKKLGRVFMPLFFQDQEGLGADLARFALAAPPVLSRLPSREGKCCEPLPSIRDALRGARQRPGGA